jgi:hypothetical protein
LTASLVLRPVFIWGLDREHDKLQLSLSFLNASQPLFPLCTNKSLLAYIFPPHFNMNFNQQVHPNIATEDQHYYTSGYFVPGNYAVSQSVMAQTYPNVYPGMISPICKCFRSLICTHFKCNMCSMPSSKHTRCKNLLHMRVLIHRKCKPSLIIQTTLSTILPLLQHMVYILFSTHIVQIYLQHMEHGGATQRRAIPIVHP